MEERGYLVVCISSCCLLPVRKAERKCKTKRRKREEDGVGKQKLTKNLSLVLLQHIVLFSLRCSDFTLFLFGFVV